MSGFNVGHIFVPQSDERVHEIISKATFQGISKASLKAKCILTPDSSCLHSRFFQLRE